MTKIKLPNGFEEISLEIGFNRRLLAVLNHADDFSVKLSQDQLIVKREKNRVFNSDTCELKTKQGVFIGVDHGEWGGSLYFYPNEKNTLEESEPNKKEGFTFCRNEYLVKEGNTPFIFEFLGKLYFTNGLTHMGFDDGELFELHIVDNNEIFYRLIGDLHSCPSQVLMLDNKVLFVTFKSLILFENNNLTTLIEHSVFSGTYPNSIVSYDEGNIFVGMRGGYLKVDLIANNFIFYKYKNIEDEVDVSWLDNSESI